MRLQVSTPSCWLLALVVLLSARTSAAQTWEELEESGAVITGIDVVVTDVFDLTNPSDNHWLGRAANAIHMQTRRGVVVRELLFSAGDVVDAKRVRETERNLRRHTFIRDARIVPVKAANSALRARVEVVDAWSLDGGVNFSRTGGATTWGANVDEGNLIGLGKHLSLAYESNRERSTSEITYTDPQLLNTRWAMSLRYADLSDGTSRLAYVERPYFSVETPYSVGGYASTANYVLTQYHLGDAAFTMPARTRARAFFGSRALVTSGRTAFRFGGAFQDQRDEFGEAVVVSPTGLPVPVPLNRRLSGPAATWAILQDRSATFQNLAGIGHTEDYNLGWAASGSIGYFARRFGSTVNAPFADAGIRKGWRTRGEGLVAAGGSIGGRRELGEWRGSVSRAEVTAYNRALRAQTIAANLHVTSLTNPDPNGWAYLDSNTGMRGYPDRFLAGDRRIVFSVDDRIITDWKLAGLLQIGFVGYADVGRIRRFDTGRWSRTYADLGAGLRFGSLRGSRNNIIQASVAFPLVRDPGMDRALLVLGNMVRF